jgi:hypothetical protein
MAALIPFGATISALHESRRKEDVDPRATAAALAKMADDIDNGRRKLESSDSKTPPVSRIVALRAANEIGDLERLLEKRDLVTVPPLAKDVWRLEMMTPTQQKVSPFFLGGECI